MRSEDVERWLKGEGVPYSYREEVPLGEIRTDPKAWDQIRVNNKDDGLILEFACAMEAGDEFPAIVVFGNNGKLEVIDGLHRIEAFRLVDRKLIDVYVVHTEDRLVIERQRRGVNRGHGLRVRDDEALLHAIHLVHSGHTCADAAKMSKLPADRVTKAVRVERVATELGIDAQGLKPRDLQALGTIDLLATRRKFARLAKEAALTGEELGRLIREARKLESVEDVDALIERWREENKSRIAKTAGGKYHPVSPLRGMRQYLRRIDRELAGGVPAGLAVEGPDELKRFVSWCKDTAKNLNTWARKVEKWLDQSGD